MTHNAQRQGPGFLLSAAAFVVVVAGMQAAEAIITPFLLAVFLAVLLTPPMYWLKRRGAPTGLAVLAVVLGFAVVGVVMGGLVGASINDFLLELPRYQASLQERFEGLVALAGRFGLAPPEGGLVEQLDPGKALGLAGQVLSALGSVLADALVIFLTILFILLEAAGLPAKVQRAYGDDAPAQMESLAGMVRHVQSYMALKTWISLGTGLTAFILLTVLGVDYALLWAVVAFILNFIPNIGSAIAAIPPVLLAFVEPGPVTSGLVAAGYVALNTTWGNIIEPRVMGRGLGLSTLVVFLSLVFWGWVLGPMGMLLSVPLTLIVKLACQTRAETYWVAVFLGGDGPLPEPGPEPLPEPGPEPAP